MIRKWQILRNTLAFGAAERLVDHDFGIRQSKPFAFGAGGQYDRGHGCGYADADRRDVIFHVIHRIYYCKAGRYRTSGRIDIE